MAKQTIYDEVEIEDFVWDPVARVFHFPCPCGDRFEISKLMLKDGEDIAICPSCSLIIRVIFDPLEWEDYEDSDEEEEEAGSVGSGSSSPASSTVSFHSAKDEEEQVVLEQKEGEIEHISKGLGLFGLGAA